MLSLIYDDESQRTIPHGETNRNLSFVLEEVFGVGGCGSREEKPRDAGTEADLLRQWAIEYNRFFVLYHFLMILALKKLNLIVARLK